MEDSGEAVDDQGSGWLEVKKKHRSSSKFSLQSWVGGLSRRNASSCGQPSVNEKDVRPLGKSEPPLRDPGRNSAVHSKANVGNSASTSKEDQKGVCSHYKCEVKEDSENPDSPLFVGSSNDRTGDTEDISHKDKAHVLPNFKWGDLEDDALVQHHEKTVGLGTVIKFGDIGDDSMLACRKHDNDSDLVLGLPCKNPIESKLVAKSIDTDSVSVQTPLLTCKRDVEESQKEVIKASSKDLEVPVVNVTLVNPDDDDVSNCKEIYTEHIKRINNDELGPGCLSSEEVMLDVKIQEPVQLDTTDLDSKDGQNRNEDSNSAMIAQDELCTPENTGIEYSGESIPSASVENHGCDSISKAQIMSAIGESSIGESKERFRERLWCFLFENLNRAVDELYLLCELECDLEQMKEAILVLQEAASDFKELKARVEEFENVKKSTQSVDGVPITLKSDHRRPHALSWEVRRMTTSPHRAEILSSSLEAFKQIQQERDKNHQTRDSKHPGLGCRNQHNVSGVYPCKAAQVSDLASYSKDTVVKPKSLNRGSDLSPANFTGEKRNVESARSSKARSLQNGRVHSHNSYSSDANSSRISQKDGVAAKSKREQGGLESVKTGSRRDKIMTESIVEKNSRDIFKKQIPLHEKDSEKEKRNVNTWKSMDAWKEKRNWEDILSSPFRVSSRASHSPGLSRRSAERARILHDKLMSPEKKKKTAFDMKREAEEKHARAMRIRSELENERVQKLQRTSEKLNRVNEWQAVRSMKLREGMYARQQRSESRHEAFLAQVARRAGDESSKVNEVRFITSLNEENKKLILRQKLHDSELRRAEKLQVIKAKQKEDMAREEAVLERKKLIEAEKLQRLAETQRKKEEAQIRREEERRASSAAREARTIEQLRRKEERVRAQQEEAELLAQKLVERLKESEQRRKFYLEQIRERASTDFRDQTSPLLRRSMNREGQSRNTPTNNSEDYQLNSVSGLGDSTLANGTQQQSLKRRIKRLRQRLMALKFEFSEPSVGSENATTIGYRTAVGTARAKIGRWLQELQRHRQARKEGAASIGLIAAEMVKFLDGKEPELQASRQAGLLDFIASALPASHTSKPEACQVTIHLLKLLRVILSAPANRSYFLAQNLLPPIIPMLSAALENYIKIAASVNIPGNTNSLSSKTSVENFESVSEVLDGFLWTVTTIIGHISSDERQLQMWDGLLELLIAYQVIHRLHELFALYDRPQVEGSPFPSSILLSLYLLIALTSRPGFKNSIDWESFPIENVVGKESEEAIVVDSIDTRDISVNNSCKDCTPPLSALNDNTVASLPDVQEDRPLDELCNQTNKYGNSVSITVDIEKKPTCSSLDLSNCKTDVPLESQKIMEDIPKSFVDEKHMVDLGAEQKNQNKPNLKQPVAFLLSAISETGLVSLPSLLTAVLLQANNRLSAEQGSNVLPSNFEEVATAVLKVLNNLALLDIKFMQTILARPDLRMEFFHLMSFLLSYCTNEWKVAVDQVGLLLFESLFLLGHFSLFHPGNQAVLRWGKSPTILHKVCDLPFVFFSDPELMPVLAGTLVAACYGCEQNKDVVQQELSLDMLLSLLRSCKNAVPNLGMDSPSECNQLQLGLELKKSQVDSVRSSRHNAKSTRVSLGKGGALGNNAKGCKLRNQRVKPCEDLPLKHSLSASETMMHCRFPMSFLEKAEQFFSAGSDVA